MQQWRVQFNAAMGAANAALAAGNFNLAIQYATQAASLAGTSEAATAAVRLRQQAYSAAGPGAGPGETMGRGTGSTPAASPTPTGGGSTPAAAPVEDPYASQKASLIAVMRDYMAANGMADLLAGMEKYVRMGYSGDAVYVMLKNDSAYQEAYNKRFAANAARRQAGLAELSPAAYIELEQGYKAAMMSRGMPSGLFDTPDDFTNLIAKNVSVREVEARLDTALQYINYDGNAEVRRQLRELYNLSDGEMAAYVLDPTRTMDFLQRQMDRNLRVASVGGAAVNSGVQTSLRDQIAEMMSGAAPESVYANSMQRFGQVAEQQGAYSRLGALSGVDTSVDELVKEQFALSGAGEVTNKKKLLASQERARFSGMSGVGSGSLSAGRRVQ